MRWAKARGLDCDAFFFSSSTAMAVSHWSCRRMNCSHSPLSPRAAKAATRCLQIPSPSRVSTRMTSMLVSALHYRNLVSIFSSSGEILPVRPEHGGVAVRRTFMQYIQISVWSLRPAFCVTSWYSSTGGPCVFQCQQKRRGHCQGRS